MYDVIGVPTKGSVHELKSYLNSIEGGHIEGSPFVYNEQLYIIVKKDHPSPHSKGSKSRKDGKYDVIGVPSSGPVAGLKTSLKSIEGRHIEGSPFIYNGQLYIIVKEDHSSPHSKFSKGGKSRTNNSYKNMKKTRKCK